MGGDKSPEAPAWTPPEPQDNSAMLAMMASLMGQQQQVPQAPQAPQAPNQTDPFAAADPDAPQQFASTEEAADSWRQTLDNLHAQAAVDYQTGLEGQKTRMSTGNTSGRAPTAENTFSLLGQPPAGQ